MTITYDDLNIFFREVMGAPYPTAVDSDYRYGVLSAGTSDVVYDSGANEGVTLEKVWFTSDSDSASIKIEYYLADGSLVVLRHIGDDGNSGNQYATLTNIQNGNMLFSSVRNDAANNSVITRPEWTGVPFPLGLKVTVYNATAGDFNVGCMVVVVK